MNALEIKHLTKSFPGFQLEDLNLTLPAGCIMGLIGENGAGKSTTIRLILDMLHKDGGSITLLGRDHRDVLTRQDVGVVLDEVGLPDFLDCRQIGKVMASIYRSWDTAQYDALLQKLNIPEGKPFRSFSRGNKMKLGIAVALAHHPRLLILDEATSGLDPVVRSELLDMLTDFTRDEDHSILISSHIVSDLEKLCDYIAFLHQGKLMLCQEKDRLLDAYGMLSCTAQELSQLDPTAVGYCRQSPYGVKALVLRELVPEGLNVTPISIEDLFVFMSKEAQ